jgi:small subunit ribosomal protein S6
MALYEHMLIARQDISAQAVDALATHLKTIVETEGGKVEKQEYWGLRTLAFRIKKNRKGHYVLLNLNAPAKAVFELERQLKINEDVLRFLTVRVDAFEQSNSSRKRERDGEGPRREGEGPRREGEGPRREGEGPRREGEGPRREGRDRDDRDRPARRGDDATEAEGAAL